MTLRRGRSSIAARSLLWRPPPPRTSARTGRRRRRWSLPVWNPWTALTASRRLRPPPAHPAAAPILRFACETLAETVEGGDAVSATTASAVWSAAGAWASHLPAWRASDGDAILDDTALDALTAIVGAAVEAKAGETAIAAIALPAARAAAAALAETEDAGARVAAGRAVAAAVASHPSAATCEVVAAARDAVDAAVGRRAA